MKRVGCLQARVGAQAGSIFKHLVRGVKQPNRRENCETTQLSLRLLMGDEYRQNISEVHLLSLADESYPRHFFRLFGN